MRTTYCAAALIAVHAVASVCPAANSGGRSRVEALRDYRAILVKQLDLSQQELKITENQLASGAVSPAEAAEPQARHLQSTAALKAFDAGLLPRQTAPRARGSESKRAREEYRGLLKLQVDGAARDVEAEQKRYELGAATRIECIEKERRLLDLELDLAALDAGLVVRGR